MDYSWKRNLLIMWLGVFFVSTAYSMAIPFLPLFLHNDLGVDNNLELWSGITFSITFLAGALISPYWGSLADKYGRKPMLLRSGFCLSVLYFLTYWVQDPYQFLGIRILQGILAGFVPASIALVATNTPEKHVGYALGIMATSTATGSILGPLIGGFISHLVGNRATFLAAGFVVLISALIAWFWAKENFQRQSGQRSRVVDDLKEAIANKPLLKILGLVTLTTSSIMILEPLLTLYVLQLGTGQKEASLTSGIIFSAVGIATILAAPRWGRIGERIGYQKTLLIGLLGGGIGNVLQIFFPNIVLFGALRFFYGLFFAAVFPALNALIVKTTTPEFRGRAFSLNQTANQLGNMAGPLLGGYLGASIGIPAVFVVNGIALLLTAGFFRTRAYREPAFYKKSE